MYDISKSYHRCEYVFFYTFLWNHVLDLNEVMDRCPCAMMNDV